MGWGYGMEVGFGPWRTRRILTHTPEAARRLAAVAQTLAEESPLSAYSRLCVGGDGNLRWPGPARIFRTMAQERNSQWGAADVDSG
jgi:hypothetical protein